MFRRVFVRWWSFENFINFKNTTWFCSHRERCHTCTLTLTLTLAPSYSKYKLVTYTICRFFHCTGSLYQVHSIFRNSAQYLLKESTLKTQFHILLNTKTSKINIQMSVNEKMGMDMKHIPIKDGMPERKSLCVCVWVRLWERKRQNR